MRKGIPMEDYRSQDYPGGTVQQNRKNLIQPDYALIQQVEMAVDGQSAHQAAGMIAAYLAGMEEAAESGDLRYLEFADEAERTLRMYLTTLRMRNAEFQKPF